MYSIANLSQWIIGFILILSSLGVLLARKPVHATLSFLVSLLMLAALYLQLSAHFIAVMQVLVYAGAILVLFMFVIVLFQDAHQQVAKYKPRSAPLFLLLAATAFLLTLIFLGDKLIGFSPSTEGLPKGYGTVESLGMLLYVDFFFPFEAVIFIFLIALVGALYTGKKEA